MRLVRLNSPHRRNALDNNDYTLIRKILKEDARNDQIKTTILTGTGEFFSSGRDMKSNAQYILDDNKEQIEIMSNTFWSFIKAFLTYPKIIITVVNGPSVGIGTTIVACSDVAYA